MNEIQTADFDSVSAQLVMSGRTQQHGSPVGWGLLGVALALGVGVGLRTGDNPVDQAVLCAATLPLMALLVDGWGLWQGRKAGRVALPLSLGGMHAGLWVWARYLTQFEVLYRLEPAGPLGGVYEVRGGIALLVGAIVLVSLAGAVWVVLMGSNTRPVFPMPDVPLNGEEVFEAQVLLKNLGYDIAAIDGERGGATEAALKHFQAGAGLTPNGVLTALTLSALRSRQRFLPGQSLRLFAAHIARRIGARVQQSWRRVWRG